MTHADVSRMEAALIGAADREIMALEAALRVSHMAMTTLPR